MMPCCRQKKRTCSRLNVPSTIPVHSGCPYIGLRLWMFLISSRTALAVSAIAIAPLLKILPAFADVPQPPCAGGAPVPQYADPPAVRTWSGVDLPACLHWNGKARLVVALAGRFHHEGDVDALLQRFGAVSSMRGLRYWSVTDKAWRVLITHAASVRGRDFTPEELKRGEDLY